MSKFVKYALYAIGGLAALFVVAIAVVVFTVDPNSFKPQIVELVKAKKQRNLTLAGDIKLTLFPKLGLDLGKASLSDHNGTAEFAAMDRLKLGVAWLPLLKQELIVEQVVVDGVRAHLVRFPDGSTNFDDLMQKEEQDQKLKFDIDSVKISNTALEFDDQKARRKLSMTEIDVTTGRIKDKMPTKVEATFKLVANNPKAAIQVHLKTGLTSDLDAKHHQLEGLDLAIKGDAASITGLDLTLSGNLDAKLETMDIVAEKIALALKGKQGSNQIEAKLDAPQLLMTKDKVSSGKIKLDAKLQQANGNFTVATTLAELSGTAHAFQAASLNLEFSGKQGENNLSGKLSSPLRGNLDSMQFGLSKIVANLAVANPKLPNGGFKADLGGNASAAIKQENVSFNGAVRMDSSNIKAKLAMQDFANPAYRFDVDIDQLDVDRYTTQKSAKQAEPERPIDLSALKKLNASGSLRVGSLKFSNVKTNNLRIDLKAANGRLDAAPIAANLYQGSLAGSVSVNATTTPQFTVKQKLSNVRVGPLIKDAVNKDVLEGRGDVNVDVATQGATVSAMKKALHGNAGLVLNDGAIKGINVAATIRNAKAKLGSLKGQQTQAASAQEKTDFTELKANFAIQNGVAHNDDLSAKSPLLRLGGNGNIDIGNNSMNYLAKATVVGSLEGQGGADTLKGLTVPVRIAGPFDALKYSLDFNAMVGEVAKAKVEQKVEEKKEEVKTKLQEQLKGGLKGLFGK